MGFGHAPQTSFERAWWSLWLYRRPVIRCTMCRMRLGKSYGTAYTESY